MNYTLKWPHSLLDVHSRIFLSMGVIILDKFKLTSFMRVSKLKKLEMIRNSVNTKAHKEGMDRKLIC